MSENVQITLIICGTIIFVQVFSFMIIKCLWNKSNKPKVKIDTDRFGYCKSPTYPRPPRPGSGIGHNPSPMGEKPGFPGSKLP